MNDFIVYKAGTLAYIDAYQCGLIPCKVLEVIENGNGHIVSKGKLRVILTANRGPYKRGEILEEMAYVTIPRDHIRTKNGSYRIKTNFAWSK